MAKDLENLIRSWGAQGELPSPPRSPTDQCLTFAQARRLAAGNAADGDRPDHVRSCEYCQGLLLDFREAASEAQVSHPRRILLFRLTGLAVAASLVIGVGIFLWLFVLRGEGGKTSPFDQPLLADVHVGLRSQVESGLAPKSPPAFASGDVILLEVQVKRPAYLTIIHLDPRGVVSALPPDSLKEGLQMAAKAGKARLGPYQLDQTTGVETFFVVASARPVGDLPARVRSLQDAYRKDGNAVALSDAILAWPADVRSVAFGHLPASRPAD
jgi:hypothetical protein